MSAKHTRPYSALVSKGSGFTNPRQRHNKKADTELAESIAAEGLLYPLMVWTSKGEDGKPRNVVLEGGRRYRAIGRLIEEKRANGLDKAVPIRPVEADTLEKAMIIALVGNVQREDLSTYDVTTTMAGLRDAGMQQKDIAGAIGKSKSWVSRKFAAWDNAIPEVLEAWRDNKLPTEDIEAIAGYLKTDPATGKPMRPKAPDQPTQKKMLEQLLALRQKAEETGDRKKLGKAKKVARGKKTGERPKPTFIRAYADAVATKQSKDPYLRGMHDMALFSLGEFSAGQFDPRWAKFAKASGFYESDKKTGAQAKAAKRKTTASSKTPARRTRKASATKKRASSRRK